MKAKRIIPKDHKEWLAERGKGIGSSDVGIIVGVSPFKTPYQLWQLKLGLAKPDEETEATIMGHLLEDAVAQRWAKATGRQIIKASAEEWMYIHPTKDYFRASPDRLYYEQGAKHNEANKCVLECKTTMYSVNKEELPKHWYAQVQWLMHVSGMKKASLAWIELKFRKFDYVDIPYNKRFCEWLESKVEEFWQVNILQKVEPQITNLGDVVCKFPNSIEGKVIQADGNLNSKVAKVKEIKAQIKELESAQEKLEEEIKMEMKDAEAIECNGSIICTWKSGKAAERFDAKTFKAEHPELAEQYTTTTVAVRRFTIK